MIDGVDLIPKHEHHPVKVAGVVLLGLTAVAIAVAFCVGLSLTV